MDELLEFIGQERNNIRIGFANSDQSPNRGSKDARRSLPRKACLNLLSNLVLFEDGQFVR